MVPIKLTLKNFMCYRGNAPPLSFEGFHVAALCGDNGSGKSALLDAITWALWGKARARSDDDLICLGESDMEVEFEFAMGDDRYRVLRKRSKAGLKRSGQSALELQAATSSGYTPISGNTIRETEHKITDLLRTDYQTFINSALLLQGRAAEFSLKSPGERKEVLANILGLSLYDELEDRARERGKERGMSRRSLALDVGRIEEQLKQRDRYQSDLQTTQEALTRLAAEIQKRDAILADLRRTRESLRLQEEQHKDIIKRNEQSGRQLSYLTDQAQRHAAQVERFQAGLSTFQAEFPRVRQRLAELTSQEQGLAQQRKQLEEISNRIHYLATTNAQLEKEGKEIKGKLDFLGLGGQGDECPLCGSELGEDGLDRIKASYQAQRQDKADAWRANDAEIKQKETQRKTLEQEIAKTENTIRNERTRWERRAESLEKENAEAEKSLPDEKKALAQVQENAEVLRRALKEDEEKRKTLAAAIESLPHIETELGRAEKACAEMQKQERDCRDKHAGMKAALLHLDQMEADKNDKTRQMTELAREEGIYEDLAKAFSKNGIQALLIEQALPEIEEEANQLLGRMTDSRMSLKIESQRNPKSRKGDPIETLDIRIADELGTRAYEMFSGGEAFRVDFALRIALSRLLAKRAGAPLPTLIIDEGFGTQDASGRGKLVEAINSIQDDFKKILVITHIEELKDAFPVRIEVSKTEDGSTFTVA